MNRNHSFEQLDDLVREELDRGTFPGAVILVQKGQEKVHHSAYGLRAEVPGREEMSRDTIFDLASLTKVVVTTTLALRLMEKGKWKLSDPVERYLEEFDNSGITLHQLLTHTSGLTAWADLFSGSDNREDALDKLFTDRWPILEPVVPPGEQVIYSDLNFILLGLAIERSIGADLAEFAREEIFVPLDMKDTCFKPKREVRNRVAPTEDSPLRKGVIRGRVHDENCFALGEVSGHAGLFSTASDLGNFVSALLNDERPGNEGLLSTEAINLLKRNFTEGLSQNRGLGWRLAGKEATSAGDFFSASAFGHTGFTGGSIWLDPFRNVGTIILTNRVHPERNRGKEAIGDFRARTHNLILGEIL